MSSSLVHHWPHSLNLTKAATASSLIHIFQGCPPHNLTIKYTRPYNHHVRLYSQCTMWPWAWGWFMRTFGAALEQSSPNRWSLGRSCSFFLLVNRTSSVLPRFTDRPVSLQQFPSRLKWFACICPLCSETSYLVEAVCFQLPQEKVGIHDTAPKQKWERASNAP